MKTIKVSEQARALNALLKRAHHENLILRSAEGNEFILAEIDDFNREIELTRQNKRLMKLLDSRAKQKATISLEEAKRRLGLGPVGQRRGNSAVWRVAPRPCSG